MGLLDDLLEGTGGSPPWGRIAATFLNGVQTVQAGGRTVLDQLLQWGSLLANNAVTAWAPIAASGAVCSAPKCDAHALVPCAACRRPFCLGHVLVSYHAEGICEPCALELVRSKQRVGPSDEEILAKAFRTLKLDDDADWDEIREAYRELAAKHHPDKQRSPVRKRRAEERMKKINAAYATLREHFKEAA